MKTNSDVPRTTVLTPTGDASASQKEAVTILQQLPIPYGAAVSASAKPTGSINWRTVLGAFQRRWFISFVLGLLLGTAGAAAAWRFVPAPYEAFSELRISAVKNRILFETKEARANFDTYKQTQMRMVKSPMVFKAVLGQQSVKQLPVIAENTPASEWLEKELSVSSPAAEFIRISLSGEDPSELKTIVNAVTSAFVTEVVDQEQADRRERLDQLEKVLAEQEDKLKRKQNALHQLAEQSQSKSLTAAGASNRQKFLLEMHVEHRKELAEVYFKLMDAKIELSALPSGDSEQHAEASDSIPSPDAAEALPEITIPDAVVDAMVRDRPEFQAASERVSQLESYVARNAKALNESHPKLIKSRSDLAAAESDLNAIRDELRPEVLENLKEQVAVRQQQQRQTVVQQNPPETNPTHDRREELQTQIQLWELKQKELEQRIDEVKVEEKETGILSFELEQYDRQIAQSESIAQSVRNEIERLKVELDSPVDISLYREAETPTTRDSKKRVMATGIAGFGLLGSVVAGFVLLEMRARRIRCVNEVAGDLSMRLVGTLPNMPRHATNGRTARKSKSVFWHNVFAESVDSARTVLLRDAALEEVRTIMVASATSGEGKTTLACHLATSLARGGHSALLIDGDLRRPSVHKVFDLPMSPGLCELLRKEAKIDEVIQPGGPEGLAVIPAGKINQEVLRLLARGRVGDVLQQLLEDYEFIILDSSPILPVTDGLLLAQHVDGVLFSIRRDISRQVKVSAARQRLSMIDVPILGAVATGLNDESSSYQDPYTYRSGYRDRHYHQPVES